MTAEQDAELWDAVVQAGRELTERQFRFYKEAGDASAVLTQALRQVGQQQAALSYVASFPDSGPALLEDLVSLALSPRTALAARRALYGSRRTIDADLRVVIERHLQTADDYDYRRLAELLGSLEAWPILTDLIRTALRSSDADIREVGAEFADAYRIPYTA